VFGVKYRLIVYKKNNGEDSLFVLKIKLLCALASIPVQDVANFLEELLKSRYFVDNEEVLQPIVDYFEKTWIGRIIRRRRKNPNVPLRNVELLQ